MVEHLIEDGKPGSEHPYTPEVLEILERLHYLLEEDPGAEQQQEQQQQQQQQQPQ